MEANEGLVIVIEDDADDQEVIKELCREIGICNNLVFFDTGYAALEYLHTSQDRPFLILCDINMPGMGGLELREVITKDQELKEKTIPFVFFSTAASDQQVRDAYEMTVQGFFLKQNTLRETAETLDIIFKYWRMCKRPK